jgi:tRNA threonylcarbamoyladenosine modification (KEOPS) complex Cgi121 subunit
MIDLPDVELTIAGVLGPLKLEDLLLGAAKANRVAPLQVLRADRVVGADHLRSAAWHTKRAFDEGRNHADKMEVEFTRYAAGERQIRRAIEKMGVPDGHGAAVVCGFGTKRKDAVPYFIDWLGLRESDSVIEADDASLAAFGITGAQLAATTPAVQHDLVLEAVASVDLMRK